MATSCHLHTFFCNCGPFFFHLWQLIHNDKLAHRNEQPNHTCKPEVQDLTHEHTFCRGVGKHHTASKKIVSKAQFKRRTFHVPNLMQMSENNRFFSFALDSAHVKFDV